MSAIDAANRIIDTAQSIAGNPIVKMIGRWFPQVAPLLEAAEKYGPTIDAAQPAISKAIEVGEPAFRAAVKAAPELIDLVRDVISKMPGRDQQHAETVATVATASAEELAAMPEVENFTRNIGGFGRMTFEEEQRLMNSMTPYNDPSQENSKFGG